MIGGSKQGVYSGQSQKGHYPRENCYDMFFMRGSGLALGLAKFLSKFLDDWKAALFHGCGLLIWRVFSFAIL